MLIHCSRTRTQESGETSKFDQKKAKVDNAATVPPSSKNKGKKAKAAKKAEEDVLTEYVEDTPPGEKKRELSERILENLV